MMLKLRDVRVSRGEGAQRYSLEVERLELNAGERFALVGPSGCGKSTLLDLLALVVAPEHADCFEFHGHNITPLWRNDQQDRLAALRRSYLGYVLQTGGLLGFLDVRSNIALPRQLLGLPDDGTVEGLAQQMGIHEQLSKRPAALSVGQRQRVSCARALAHGPALILADEPTAALDPLNAERVMHSLLAQASLQGACGLIATHDETLASRCGLERLGFALRRDADGGVTAQLEART